MSNPSSQSWTQWLKSKAPKLYLVNSNEYPKFEFPKNSGVMHEYPFYEIAGKKLPTGYVAFGGLIAVVSLIKLATMVSGGSRKSDSNIEWKFPEPKRDWEKEKEEFISSYVAAGKAKAGSH